MALDIHTIDSALADALEMALESARAGETEGIFALVFFLLTFACLYSLFYQLRIRGWPTTNGTLLSAETAELGFTESVPSGVDFVNSVAYEYVVNNQRYVSNRFSPWIVVLTYNFKPLLEHQLKKITQQFPLQVIYNPRKPGRAFLKRPGIIGMVLTALCSGFCFLTPIFIFGP